MPVKVLMPQLGESVVEGTITRWLKSVGEAVDEYEPLVEVNTDKVDTEVPSPAAGTLLEILTPEGTVAQAGMVLAVIGGAGEGEAGAPADGANEGGARNGGSSGSPELEGEAPGAVAAPQTASPETSMPQTAGPVTAGPQPAGGAAPAAGRSRDLGFISPVVAKIAGEHGIDLFQVPGTGQGGRITKKDVLAFLESGQPAAAPASVERPASITPEKTEAPPAQQAKPTPQPQAAPAPVMLSGDGEVQPLTTVRRSIAEHMVMSKRTSPHVTTIMEADMSRVVAHRKANKDGFAKDGAALTFTAYFVAATSAALKAFPMVNSSWTEEGIRLHRAINIGMATSLGEAGLIVPVIKNADGLSLLGIARAINDLANRARGKQLKPDEVQGGTFTITNHGISKSLFATPIINQPQCGILGVGMMQKRVVVASDEAGNDSIAIRPMVYLGLTFDHRILDGAMADHFLEKVVTTLQEWS